MQHPPAPVSPSLQPGKQEPETTAAYDACIQEQQLEKLAQGERRAELEKERGEERRVEAARKGKEAMAREQDMGGEREWLSVEESQEKEWGW